MANLLYANNAVGTLSAPITNAATSLTLNPGQAALFPNPSAPQVFYATLTDAATQTLKEIVQVTAVAGNIFSIVRAQDGTLAQSWNTGDIVEQCTIALELRNFENAAEGLFGATGNNVPVVPSSTLGIVGTTTSDNANAGSIGEFISATTSNVPLASGTNTNINSLSLTPGDWDVQITAAFAPSGGSFAAQVFNVALSTTAGSLGSTGQSTSINLTAVGSLSGSTLASPVVRFSLAVTTTVFGVGRAVYNSTTCSAATLMRARRVR
jgi:hypothetical protein